MKISAVKSPNFGIKYTSRTWQNWDGYATKFDQITLDNGKDLKIYTESKNGEILSKLQYLTDSAGNWIKSKLKDFRHSKVLESERNMAKNNTVLA